MSHKSRSISGSSCESQRIYNQRRYIHKLEKENQQYKSILDEISKYAKEYITEDIEYFGYIEMTKEKYAELLQILDKGVKKCQ